jgi:hypothetical protein
MSEVEATACRLYKADAVERTQLAHYHVGNAISAGLSWPFER